MENKLARFLVASIFIVTGLYALLFGYQGYIDSVTSLGLPFATALVLILLVVKVTAGSIVAFSNDQQLVKFAAGVLIIFTILVSILFHNPFIDSSELNSLMKNISIIGGLIYVFQKV